MGDLVTFSASAGNSHITHDCTTCKFFLQSRSKTIGGPKQGECRFSPPQIVVVGIDQRNGPMMATVFPVVNETHYCFSYQSKIVS